LFRIAQTGGVVSCDRGREVIGIHAY
jgi:hypothetical protein